MILPYPQYSTSEYNCFRTLTIACEFWQKMASSRSKYGAAVHRLSEAQRQADRGDLNVFDECIKHIQDFLNKLPKTFEERSEEIANIYGDYQTLMRRPRHPFTESKKVDTALRLLNVYTGFDRKAFDDDISSIIEKRGDKEASEHLKTVKTSHNAFRLSLTRAKNDIRDNVFSVVPHRWRDHLIPDNDNEIADYCVLILDSFLLDWESRARCFTAPVTIYGTSISTLPRSLRDEWMKWFTHFGFERMHRSPLYSAITSESKEPVITDLPVFIGDSK